MIVFLDFEASSLSKRSYPIEVAWVFEDGRSDAHLIKPAPQWDDWDPASEAIHHISRDELLAHGRDHEMVVQTMLNDLAGHDLRASAPSWDGKWLSTLLRASGRPRHSLRLRGTDAARREVAHSILSARWTDNALDREVEGVLDRVTSCEVAGAPAHRALSDARDELRRWLAVRDAALDRLRSAPGHDCPA